MDGKFSEQTLWEFLCTHWRVLCFVASRAQVRVALRVWQASGRRGHVAAQCRAGADRPRCGALPYRVIPLARTLPDELLHAFQPKVAGLPRTTDVEQMTVERVGQDRFAPACGSTGRAAAR